MIPNPVEPLPTNTLLEQLVAARRARSEALQRLKAAGANAAKGTPYSKMPPRPHAEPEAPSVVSDTTSSGRVELQQKQVAAVQSARAYNLEKLKRTTYLAIQTFRETAVIDREQLQAELAAHQPSAPGT